jgi:hypothetical protein
MASTQSDGPAQAPQAAGFLLLHPRDNVLICTRDARAGTSVDIDGDRHVLSRDIALGHKIARVALKAGDTALRYGVPIGTMTAATAPGEHVHSHNLASDYLPAHGREAVRNTEGR